MRSDYCPACNEPCMCMCDEPCAAAGEMRLPCPACPDGNEWSSNGPTGRVCSVCAGNAYIVAGATTGAAEHGGSNG